jgi:predicted XRE-type DNA-binding protein
MTRNSIFDAIVDTPQEAVNLRLRAEVMQRIAQRIERKGWTQREAAQHGGITQPRVNDLLRGRLSRFSLDALVNIAAAMGLRVELKAAA